MSTLLDIGSDIAALEALLDETGGELTPDSEPVIDAWFAELGAARESKIDAYCSLVREFELRAAARKEEAERLLMRVAADTNNAKRLRSRLQFHLELSSEKRIDTRRYRVSVCANGGKQPLQVLDPASLPYRFQRQQIVADTDRIREALAAGETVEGAMLLPRGNHLRIG